MSKATPVTDGEFEKEVLQSTTPVMVDFWATWCGPCQVLGPVVDALAEEYAGKLKVFKLNVDENPATPPKYGIRGIPTLILFKNGEAVERIVGAQPKQTIDTLIKKVTD